MANPLTHSLLVVNVVVLVVLNIVVVLMYLHQSHHRCLMTLKELIVVSDARIEVEVVSWVTAYIRHVLKLFTNFVVYWHLLLGQPEVTIVGREHCSTSSKNPLQAW